jgi:quercetin dioxygenase-like cupin family protein
MLYALTTTIVVNNHSAPSGDVVVTVLQGQQEHAAFGLLAHAG